MHIGTTSVSLLNYQFTRVFKEVVHVHVYGVMDTNNCTS